MSSATPSDVHDIPASDIPAAAANAGDDSAAILQDTMGRLSRPLLIGVAAAGALVLLSVGLRILLTQNGRPVAGQIAST
jgi:hypothetical protein